MKEPEKALAMARKTNKEWKVVATMGVPAEYLDWIVD